MSRQMARKEKLLKIKLLETSEMENDIIYTEALFMSLQLVEYIRKHQAWSRKTFGPGDRKEGLTTHLKLEIQELIESDYSLKECVDVLIIGIDIALNAGYAPMQIADQLCRKQALNAQRAWPKNTPAGQPVEHIRNAGFDE